MRAHDPSAAHFPQGTAKILLAEAQTGENPLGLRLQLVSAQGVVASVDIFVMVGFGGVLRIPRLDLPLQFRDLLRHRHGQVQHRAVTGGRRFLRQVSDHGVFFPRDGSGVRLLRSEDEGKQSGFARAIWPNETYTLGPVDLKRDIFKQCLRSIRLRNF